MSEIYYLDTNALVKYSCYQQYLKKPEEGIEAVRKLINSKENKIYLSHLTLWEFYQVFLKMYRTNEKWKVFGDSSVIRESKLMRLFFEIKDKIEEGYFCMEQTVITPEIFELAQRLMIRYIAGDRRALDSIDALHIALVQFLSEQNNKEITLVSADKTMLEISEKEGLNVLTI
ncbi:MAG: type II toxin-antitoxin system VapC family toxin [Methylococcales bacterium]|nr:type II toxin-antitoxin system VapC family toxin [Methylococcales bacterium]